MIFDLVNDFADVLGAMPEGHPRHRILKLLDEAIRRDAHFIDRHPTTLFQCLWNTCWWYDCPEAVMHYHVEDEDGWEAEIPTETSSPNTLHEMMQRYHSIKRRRHREFRWLRSLRPPQVRLGSSPLLSIHTGSANVVCDLSINSDGRRIIAVVEDGRVLEFDARTGRPTQARRQVADPYHRSYRNANLTVYPNEPPSICCVVRNRIQIADIDGSSESLLNVPDHVSPECAAVSPNQNVVVCGCRKGILTLLDKAGSCICTVQFEDGQHESISQIAFSPVGDRFAVALGCKVFLVEISEPFSEQPSVVDSVDHDERVTALAYSPTSTFLGVACDDRTIHVWNTGGLDTHKHCALYDLPNVVSALSFLNDGSHLACGSIDGQILVWEGRDRRVDLSLKNHRHNIRAIRFTPTEMMPGEPTLATGDESGDLNLWELQFATPSVQLNEVGARVNCIRYSPRELLLAIGYEDSRVGIHDGWTGEPLQLLECHDSGIQSLHFSHGEDRLVSCSDRGEFTCWQLAEGSALATLQRESQPIRDATSPDGRFLANAEDAWGTIYGTIREVATGDVLSFEFPGESVVKMGFSSDGRYLVILSRTFLSLWDIESGRLDDSIPIDGHVEADQPRFDMTSDGTDSIVIDREHVNAREYPIAFFPSSLQRTRTHPRGRLWAGSVANHLHLLVLEGDCERFF